MNANYDVEGCKRQAARVRLWAWLVALVLVVQVAMPIASDAAAVGQLADRAGEPGMVMPSNECEDFRCG